MLLFALIKVLICLSSTEVDEPHLKESFIAGYESAGRHFDTNNVTIVNGINNAEKLKTQLDYSLANGYDIVLHNWGPQEDYSSLSASYYHVRGIQIICPGGSNVFHDHRTDSLPRMIYCAAGDTSNQTSYRVEFFSGHPFSNYPILSMAKNGGDTITVVVDIATNGAFAIPQGYYAKFSSVTGWQNNPIGLIRAIPAGYDRFKIIYNVGTGSFSSGTAKLYFESYSHAYIAGIFAAIRDSLKCSNWEARYRMRMTASNSGSATVYDGFGKPSLSDALAWSGSIPDDPFTTLGAIGKISALRNGNVVYVTIDSVANATRYQIFDNTTLLTDYDFHFRVLGTVWMQNAYTYNVSRTIRSIPHQFWYRAYMDTVQTLESEKKVVSYPKFSRIRIH